MGMERVSRARDLILDKLGCTAYERSEMGTVVMLPQPFPSPSHYIKYGTPSERCTRGVEDVCNGYWALAWDYIRRIICESVTESQHYIIQCHESQLGLAGDHYLVSTPQVQSYITGRNGRTLKGDGKEG